VVVPRESLGFYPLPPDYGELPPEEKREFAEAVFEAMSSRMGRPPATPRREEQPPEAPGD
jgi:hypothetical protein